jgi:hypothetical protein
LQQACQLERLCFSEESSTGDHEIDACSSISTHIG